MPATIASIVAGAAFAAGASVAATNVILAITASVVTAGIRVGVSLAISAAASAIGSSARAQQARQRPPGPEDVKSSFRQGIPDRIRHYGVVKASGVWVFGETNQGNLYKVLYLGEGQIVSISKYFIDDKEVVLDGNGLAANGAAISKYQIKVRMGADSETAFSEITSVFPQWTSAHRGDGAATLMAKQFAVPAQSYSFIFPNGINTTAGILANWSRVYIPTTGAIAWSDNAAAIQRDYLTHKDGYRLPIELFQTPQAIQGWKDAYNKCDEQIPLKAGGSEKRYRLWGSYRFSERPADILLRMQQASDSHLILTPDGGLTIEVGDDSEPTVILDETTIKSVIFVKKGRNIQDASNTIKAIYTSSATNSSVDMEPWVDAASVAEFGESVIDLSLIMSPSDSQSRRLAKIAWYRANPDWVMKLLCDLGGLEAYQKSRVRMRYPMYGIDENVSVDKMDWQTDGSIVKAVIIDASSMPNIARQWSPAQEEGNAPVEDFTTPDTVIPPVGNFTVTIDRIVIGANVVPYGVLAFDMPPSDALKIEAQFKKSSEAEWTPIAVSDAALKASSPVISDGIAYEFQVRHVTASGREGAWSASILITPTADETAPGTVSSITALGGAAKVDIDWIAPNSANYAGTRIYRHSIDDFAAATLIHTEYGSPNSIDSYQDAGLAAGDYFYWLVAINGSGVGAAEISTGSVTAT